MAITKKQHIFITEYVRNNDALASYQKAYNTHNMTASLALKRANALLDKENIKRLIDQHRDKEGNTFCADKTHHKSINIDKTYLTDMLMNAYKKASEDKRGASAMISASLAIAKLNNLLDDSDTNPQSAQEFHKLIDAIKNARKRLQTQEHDPQSK